MSKHDDRIIFRCPKCGADLAAKKKIAGTSGHCPRCSNSIEVPLKSETLEFGSRAG